MTNKHIGRNPKFVEARYDIFPNTNNQKGKFATCFTSIEKVNELHFSEGNLVVKFKMKGYEPLFGKVWRRFIKTATLPANLNYILKESAKELNGKTKYDISRPESKALRERHAKHLMRTLAIDEYTTAWHSLMVDGNGKPMGFVTIVNREEQWFSYITQSKEVHAKHIIEHHNPLNTDKDGGVAVYSFKQKEYDTMLKMMREAYERFMF